MTQRRGLDADGTVSVLEARYGSHRPVEPRAVEDEFATLFAEKLRARDVQRALDETLQQARDETRDTLEAELGGKDVTRRYDSAVRRQRERLVGDLRTFGNEIGDSLRHAVRTVSHSDDTEAVAERLSSEFDDSTLEHRIELIARMSVQELINDIKLSVYEDASDVDEVTLTASCSDMTPDIVADLAGCDGEAATASLDTDERVGVQFQSQTDVEPSATFDPLPDVPPFHFGDRSEFVAVMEDDDD